MTSSIEFRNTAIYSAPASMPSRTGSVSAGDAGVTSQSSQADQVTISDAAISKLSNSKNDWKEKLIANAKANPQEGNSYLDASTSVITDGSLLDISDPPKNKAQFYRRNMDAREAEDI